MSAFSSRGTKIYLTKGGATPASLVPTAISSAKPTVVSVADTTGMAKGDVVQFGAVGFSELDNKVFLIDSVVDGNDITLLGSDTSATTGSLGGTPTMKHWVAADIVSLCLSSFTINNEEPTTTSVATFCDPSASLPSAVQGAGTAAVGGYVNDKDADYIEMLLACEDGAERIIILEFPNHGSLVAPITFGSMGYEVPIEGAPAWSATGVLGSKFRHLY